MTTIEIIGTIVATVTAVGGLIWAALVNIFKLGKVMQHLDEFENRVTSELAKIQNGLDKLPCAFHHDDIKSIKDYLVGKDAKAVNILSMKQSPLVLSPLGKKVYEIIKGGEFINDNRDLLMERLSHKNPRTALDVELSAKEVCLELLGNKIFDDIKDIVYNYPAIKTDIDGKESDYIITIADVCFVLSIPLRDMYLKAHPEINTL